MIEHFKKKKKSNWIKESWITGENHSKICWTKSKNLIDASGEDKKAKSTKKCVIKRKVKCQDYKKCLEAAQVENKINHLEKKNHRV